MTAVKKTTTRGTKKGAAVEKKKTAAKAKAGSARASAKKTGKGSAKKTLKKQTFTDIVREKLLADKKKILQDVSSKIREESNVLKRETGDIYDIASDERERELSLMLGDRERKKLAEIDLALERIQDGLYGFCEDCGEPVGEKRLEVLPFTRVCVDCQSRHERDQRVRGNVEDEGLLRIIDKSDTDIDSFH